MSQSQIAPYGSWKSPITADLIVTGTIGLGGIALDGDDVYWSEGRPAEAGRNAIVRRTPDGKTADVTLSPFNVRTRVHEYGGGAFTVKDGIIYFSNFADQRLYKQTPDGEPQPLSQESGGNLRYADAVIDTERGRIICVCEDHTGGGHEPVNTLVSINLDKGEDIQVLASGSDFYSSPRLRGDRTQLAWLSWNHPNMPWDGTQLWVAPIQADGLLGEPQLVAGGVDESVFQPEWSPDGVLYFVSDRTGWWNLYRWNPPQSPLGKAVGEIEPLCEMEAEFGLPQWVFGMSTYAVESANRIICTYTQEGIWYLASLDTQTKQLEVIETPYTDISSIHAANGRAVFMAGSATEPTSVVQIDLATRQLEVLRRTSELEIDTGYLSVPQAIAFPTENNLTAYAFFYPPKNKDYTAPAGEKPPLIVKSHGGPTASTSSAFNLKIQYWTSRGFAFVDVNYGGSTGYGRDYHQRLRDNWGIVDVDDCANAAKYLAEQGLVDGERLAIAGGSAGGYTTLAALTFRDIFKAGASYYGVSDLEVLAKDTHKFEARYLDGLIGPYPERKDLYEKRSPIHFTAQLSCPVIFFQGLEDKVVPPNQAEMMVEALKAKGLPVAYVAYEGEQHGFRRAENIKRTLDGEFYFYSRVFGFEPAEMIEPVAIENLGNRA
ncbi:S9 family peptidase [Allocoleopsis franciscana]|uniref:Dipeptidyl aminopeptidase/acylaminoacyl peptidase n=1 Tax=Allocoleopsis franciscana PCC 7113 TaxID=1173027 RepID=K9WC79_9CYAN|nr:S9 family peptidase [Allocoleopsis franciscana]AFZ17092.1 dipeptidyl aminopeptidase/acylaminoacyl peptidase [Allocoleopsis franciscana PCC 7113]